MIMKKLSEDHYIVMDDSEPEIGGWVYSMDGIHQWFGQVLKTEPLPKKITHSTNIDWNEVYYIPLSEVKELLGIVNAEMRTRQFVKSINATDEEMTAYYCGYRNALEDTKDKKYTEKDMQWALHHAKYHQELTIEEIIQALHQPKTEWEVELVDGKLKLK